MNRRIFSSMFLLALLAVAATSLLTALFYYRTSERQLKTEVQNEADYLKAARAPADEDYLQALDVGSHISLFSPAGDVLFDNRSERGKLEHHGQRPEVEAALRHGHGEAIRMSDSLARKTYYYALRLPDGKILRVGKTTPSVFSALASLLPWMLGIALVVVVLALNSARTLTERIAEPINAIDLERPLEFGLYDEIAPLLTKIRRRNDLVSRQMSELRQQQQALTTITENMSEGFLIVDQRTDILSYNKSALKLLGAQRAVNGQSVLTLNRSESFRKAVDLALSGYHNQQPLQIRDHYYQVLANPVYHQDEIAGALIIIVDVTEKEERENMRREFTANVSHELKTPLTSISGFAEIIKNGFVKSEDIPAFAGKIYDQSQQMIVLVNDIIKLSQLDENSVPVEKEAVDLYAVAADVLEQLKGTAKEKNLSCELQGEHLEVTGVRSILQEMIYNLCDNAIKYNKENGNVTVAVSSKPVKKISVSDTGIGIPAAYKERVFERFFRVDKSHSRQIGGTGLGLSIVKHGASYHNAKVSLDSKPGAGTTVTISWQ
jgi:two-component system phosphate regulon sensor histidine kinase PhoR